MLPIAEEFFVHHRYLNVLRRFLNTSFLSVYTLGCSSCFLLSRFIGTLLTSNVNFSVQSMDFTLFT